MALFLLYDRDNHHPNPIKDARGCYKRGMIVEVLDDSKHDGDLVKNPIMPPWILVRVTGVTKQQALKYMHPRLSEIDVDTAGNPLVIGRRLYKVLVDTIPAVIRNKIIADRFVEVSLAQVRNYIQNLQTGTVGE
jgi:hypothetical protein